MLSLECSANVSVGSLNSPAVGEFGAEDENISGGHFHTWLTREHLFLPQTFEHLASAPTTTWVHSTGQESRIDYVAVDQCLHQAVRIAQRADLDLSLSTQDHFAVQVTLALEVSARPPQRTSRHTETCITPTAPSVPWHVDVHTHADLVHTWLQARIPKQQARAKRKQHLTERSWSLISQKHWHRKRFAAVRKAKAKGTLRALFQAWCAVRPLEPDHRNHQHFSSAVAWLRTCDFAIAFHWRQYSKLTQEVLKSVKQDDHDFYKHLADHRTDESLPALWKSLKAILPKTRDKRTKNLRCVGPASDALHRHYDALEGGQPVDPCHLVQQCFDQQASQVLESPLQVPLHQLPSRQMVEHFARRTKDGKAAGVDSVPPHIMKQAAVLHSDVLHSLMLKCFVLAAEPAHWKGGLLRSIPKKQGALTAEAMRGIALLTGLGKLYHAILRQNLMDWLEPRRVPGQLGGFKSLQTAYATQAINVFANLAHRKGLPSALVFVDLRSAFHMMIREAAFGAETTFPVSLRQLLEREGFDVATLTHVAQELDNDFTSTAPLCAQRALRDAHSHTWYRIAQSQELHHTTRGSRPGSPLADAAFNLLMRRILLDLSEHLQEHEELRHAMAQLGVGVPPIAWMDDLCAPLVSLQSSSLDTIVHTVVSFLDGLMTRFGMQINYAKNKTEVMCTYRGKGAKAAREHRFVQCGSTFTLAPGKFLRVVASYQHLGTRMSQSLSNHHNIASRIGRASQLFRQLSKPVFSNRSIYVALRLKLLESLVLSTVFFGAGSWHQIAPRSFDRLQAAVVHWQKHIAGVGFWSEQRTSDEVFQGLYTLAPLALRLHKHRLLFAFQLAHSAPDFLSQAILEEDACVVGSWISALIPALQWWTTMDAMPELEGILQLPAAQRGPSLWQWLRTHRTKGPSQVRTAVLRATLEQSIAVQVRHSVQALISRCRSAGVVIDSAPLPAAEPQSSPHTFECHQCEVTFSTLQAWQAHQRRKHKLMSLERRYCFGTTCAACSVCFWTEQRLQIHLRNSRDHAEGCLQHLVRHYQPLDEPMHEAMPAHLAGQHRLPSVCTPGPEMLLTPQYFPPATHSLEWRTAWAAAGGPDALDLASVDAMHQDIEGRLHSLETENIPQTDALLMALLEPTEATFPHHSEQGMWALALWGLQRKFYPGFTAHSAFEEAVSHIFWDVMHTTPLWELLRTGESIPGAAPLLGSIAPKPTPVAAPRSQATQASPPSLYSCLSSTLEMLLPREVGHWPDAQPVPVLRLPTGEDVYVLVHMFSGRRRALDAHHWIDLLSPDLLPAHRVVSIAMDTAVHERRQPLSWHSQVEDHPGPVPLRSAAEPWGISGLSVKSLKQLMVGNQLMMTNLNNEIAVVLGGGASVMEHPGTPADASRASVWKTQVHEFIMKAPLARQVPLRQVDYGAASVKPTILRGLQVHGLANGLSAWRLPHSTLPTKQLGGWDVTARAWKTASAKEYPPQLSKAMAISIMDSLAYRTRQFGVKSTALDGMTPRTQEWFFRIIRHSAAVREQSYMPDYQPQG
eukprot:Skav207918  [mRNA]  locus=scaffold190:418633:423325:+ [translate_table: standard]